MIGADPSDPAHPATPFVAYILESIEHLQSAIGSFERSAEVEAVLLCVQALSHSPAGATAFCQRGFTAIAIDGFLRDLPAAPSTGVVLIWRALVLTLYNFVAYARDVFVASAGESALSVFVDLIVHLSHWYQDDESRANVSLGRVLRDAVRFLALYMDDAATRACLAVTFVSDTSTLSRLTAPCFVWIVARAGLESGPEKNQVPPTAQANICAIASDLATASLDLLSNLVQDASIAVHLTSLTDVPGVVERMFHALEANATICSHEAAALLRFVCLFAEQLALTALSLSVLRPATSTSMLLHVVRSERSSTLALALALRLLWLFEVADQRDQDSSSKSSGGTRLTAAQVIELATAVSDRAAMLRVNARASCNALGLLAELLQRQPDSTEANERSRVALTSLLRRLLPRPSSGKCSKTLAASWQCEQPLVYADMYATAKWMTTMSYDALGVQHQFARCFRFCTRDDLDRVLGTESLASSSRIDRAFQLDVFVPSIQLLPMPHRDNVSDSSSEDTLAMPREIQSDVLEMLANVLLASNATSGDEDSSSGQSPSRLCALQRLASQEALLLRCSALIASQHLELAHQVRAGGSRVMVFSLSD